MTAGLQKAHEAVRPARAANQGALASLESQEEKASTKGNPDCQSTRRTQCRASVPQAAGRIGKAAQRNPKEGLTALFHHLTPEGPGATYLALKKDVAAGVDDMTCEKYGEGLDERLLDLHQRLHRGGAYCAPPLRRLEIAEPDGWTRQLGMAALEDKIAQQAVVDVILTPIYEGESFGFSYGFRAGRWLNAGVMEGESWSNTGRGTPQEAFVSPDLANMFQHYVLDLWSDRERRSSVPDGEAIIVRYANDVRVQTELPGPIFRLESNDYLGTVSEGFTQPWAQDQPAQRIAAPVCPQQSRLQVRDVFQQFGPARQGRTV